VIESLGFLSREGSVATGVHRRKLEPEIERVEIGAQLVDPP
jgi:hypothetical protein